MSDPKPDLNAKLFGQDLFGEHLAPKVDGALKKRFLIPPFSVLNAREGAWQERKRAWVALGIKSELGRGGETGSDSTYNDREWIKAKGLQGLAQDAHVKPAPATSRAEPSRRKPLTWGINPNGMSTTNDKAYTEQAKRLQDSRRAAAQGQPATTANANAGTAQDDPLHEKT